MIFDAVLMVDWSGGNDRGAAPKADAIWTCLARAGLPDTPRYHRNRTVAEAYLHDTLTAALAAGERILVGFDLCFAYPTGFASALVGQPDPLAVWDWFAARITDAPDSNNRFDVAGQINAQFPGTGPFWANALKRNIAHLPRKGTDRRGHGLPERRAAERAAPQSCSPWQLAGAGAVGGQAIMAFPTLSRLRHHFGDALAVWPFQAPDRPIVLAETYFSLLPQALARFQSDYAIKDAAQTALFAQVFSAASPQTMAALLDHPATEEGWVLGLGQEDLLKPPSLRNDCFVLPPGTHWTPVDAALEHLRDHLSCVVAPQQLPLAQAAGRYLAADVAAIRAHPPHPNSAVDGYALAGPLPDGAQVVPLHPGRAAAGDAFDGTVPPGHALRILTGANIPAGTDTVVLQEDVTLGDRHLHLTGPLKHRANARRAGEDMTPGQTILTCNRRLTPADLATAAATGIGTLPVYGQLRVGVLSTGDELVPPGAQATDAQIYDANRAMLLADVAGWGHTPVDLGCAPDNREQLRSMLDQAAPRCDAILTSGGASAGDEDHMSALLQNSGSLALWRIAMKPGRPLALGLWQGVPVFGLPGNPVAAQVCALILARPALRLMAGGGWCSPVGYQLPAGFAKSKKAGRREYLRARLDAGRVITFPSEGSGRVSGLSWATGLVALPDDACIIAPGDPVTYLPFDSLT